MPLEKKFMMLGCAMNRQGKAHEGIQAIMQSANKAWWTGVKIYRSKDVPWRVKENQVQKDGGTRLRLLLWKWKLVVDPENSRQN